MGRMQDLGRDGAFVLGPGRCGSTMLSNTLKTHPDILSLSEFFAMQGTRGLLPGKLSGAAYWKRLSSQTKSVRLMMTPENAPNEFLYRAGMGRFPIDNVPPVLASTLPHLSDDPDALFDELAKSIPSQPRQTVECHHAMLFERLKELCGGQVWIERTGMSIMYARLLPQLFPKAKYVMMYRDGRDVALSFQAFKPIRPMIWNWKWSRRTGPSLLNLDYPSGRSRYLRIAERFFGPPPLVKWMLNTPPPLRTCAEFWSQATLQSLPEFDLIPANQRTFLRFEALTQNPNAELTRLLRFLDIEADPAWLKQAVTIPKRLAPRWKTLELQEQNQLSAWTEEARSAIERKFPL